MSGPMQGETDATERVLSSMLMETLDLMSEVSDMGDRRAASAETSPHETAVYLRLSSRLARIGGWIMAQEVGSDRDKAVARVVLGQARRSGLDGATDLGPLAETVARVDRLAERAARLEQLLHESLHGAPSHADSERREIAELARRDAQVLVFPTQSGGPN